MMDVVILPFSCGERKKKDFNAKRKRKKETLLPLFSMLKEKN
jgi:hypothetical protein